MTAPVVIFAVGNPSRGDDALGPLLLAKLAEWLAGEGRAAQFELIEDFQLQIEHALDLCGRRLALFIDAGAHTPGPYLLRRLEPARGAAHSTHALSPEAVLAVYHQTEGGAPAPAYVLCVRGESFGLGAELSTAACAAFEAAFVCLTGLCREATPQAWARCVTGEHEMPKC